MRRILIMMLIAVTAIIVVTACGGTSKTAAEVAKSNFELTVSNFTVAENVFNKLEYAEMIRHAFPVFSNSVWEDQEETVCLLSKIERSTEANPESFRVEEFFYDEQNRLERQVNFEVEYLFVYDGENLSERQTYVNGQYKDSIYYSHDIDGNLTSMMVKPNDLSSLQHVCFYYQYDVNNHLNSEQRDFHCDGTQTHCWSYEYDIDGNLTQKSRDEKCSGELGENLRVYTMSYDLTGNILSELYDPSDDEVAEIGYEKNWAYDMDRLSVYSMDSNLSTSPQFNTTNIFTYEDNWTIEHIEWNESCASSLYNSDGQILEERFDQDCDGSYGQNLFTYTCE